MSHTTRTIITAVLVVAATVCLVLGLTQPVVKLTYLYFWSETYSLAAIVARLFEEGEFFLCAVILLFSIIFPALKLVYLLAAFVLRPSRASAYGRFHTSVSWLGKWSMLDVLVLALIVFYAKSTSLSDAIALPGVYLFTASVILTMLAYAMVEGGISTEPEANTEASRLIENRTRRPDSVPS
jgi:paraquat-inducible protein A